VIMRRIKRLRLAFISERLPSIVAFTIRAIMY
jgi:hypothetical protein